MINVVLLSNIISGMCLVVVALILVFRWVTRRNAIRLYITKVVGGRRKIIKHVYLSPKKDEYIYNDKHYAINLKEAIIDEKNRPLVIYDYEGATPISLDKKDSKYESRLMSVFLKTKIYGKVFGKGLVDNLALILIVIAIFSTIILGMYMVYQNQLLKKFIEEIIKGGTNV